MTRPGEPDDPDDEQDRPDPQLSEDESLDFDGHELGAEPPSAADIKAEFTDTSPGWVYLERLAVQERRWLKGMVDSVAYRHNVDRDDLLQELQLRMQNCEVIDQGRDATRSWLRRRATWQAQTMSRSGRRGPGTAPLDDSTPDPPALPATGIDDEWSVERFQALGLSRDQAQNVLLLAWDIDISMQEHAASIEQSYDKVRKDRSRGLGKIKKLFELTVNEEAALRTYRRMDSISDAAAHLNLPRETVHKLVAEAEKKIDRALSRPDGADLATGRPAGEKDEADVQ